MTAVRLDGTGDLVAQVAGVDGPAAAVEPVGPRCCQVTTVKVVSNARQRACLR